MIAINTAAEHFVTLSVAKYMDSWTNKTGSKVTLWGTVTNTHNGNFTINDSLALCAGGAESATEGSITNVPSAFLDEVRTALLDLRTPHHRIELVLKFANRELVSVRIVNDVR